ncbi:EF-hand domain-containing protein [Streptomyces sp. NBC_00091]|uniref:EF-hand domain-containing protein n=1 Tax=Streptomyces sp. NBC_00091 TaxID=2975648 RepID=UPI0022580D5B|nr:EF-hand domain-containing protein [Streptomyces sp. NBC_00091]MCX5381492.1 EF-hand domain-containing protein [Streptomyces sp. NBC_00091]
MDESSAGGPLESVSGLTRRGVLRGTAGVAAGAVTQLASGAQAAAATGPDPVSGAAVASQLAAADIAAAQDPLLRRKQLRAFEVLDVDGDGFVTQADTLSLARKFAAFTDGGVNSAQFGQLVATIEQMWQALVEKPRWVPDVKRLDAEQFVTVAANSVATTPDKTLQYISLVTNLVFLMADSDHDAVISKEDSLRLDTEVLGFTREKAEEGWAAVAPADPEKVTYAEMLVAVTDFVTSVDSRAPGNLILGRL